MYPKKILHKKLKKGTFFELSPLPFSTHAALQFTKLQHGPNTVQLE